MEVRRFLSMAATTCQPCTDMDRLTAIIQGFFLWIHFLALPCSPVFSGDTLAAALLHIKHGGERNPKTANNLQPCLDLDLQF